MNGKKKPKSRKYINRSKIRPNCCNKSLISFNTNSQWSLLKKRKVALPLFETINCLKRPASSEIPIQVSYLRISSFLWEFKMKAIISNIEIKSPNLICQMLVTKHQSSTSQIQRKRSPSELWKLRKTLLKIISWMVITKVLIKVLIVLLKRLKFNKCPRMPLSHRILRQCHLLKKKAFLKSNSKDLLKPK